MPTVTARSPKSKITVSLSQDVLHQLDAFLESTENQSRSRLVEEAIRRWLHEVAQREIERQVEDYYLSLSKAERKDDKTWSEISTGSAKHLWDI